MQSLNVVVVYNVLRYVNIASILKHYLPIRCCLSESSVELRRGEAEGFKEEFVDTLFLRCAAT